MNRIKRTFIQIRLDTEVIVHKNIAQSLYITDIFIQGERETGVQAAALHLNDVTES